ncbi:MAG TPA: AraC family ligand binding domain-containing protein [Gammaproteobacteria bacterium]
MKRRASASAVPIVDFYGDASEWSTSALLHSEPLIERSRLHAWKIRPHRHSSLAQLFWLTRGAGEARFDGERYVLSAPCMAVVPELCVHEFEWAEDSDGYALSIASALVHDLRHRIGAPAGAFTEPEVLAASNDREYLDMLFSRIQEEYVHARPLKEALLESLVKALAIWVARHGAPARHTENASRRALHYERFTELLERRHRSGWAVTDYAKALGITPAHLNAICRETTGSNALRLIHERVLLAARRELAYTDKSTPTSRPAWGSRSRRTSPASSNAR